MNDKSILIIPTPRDCEHCDLPFTIDEILGRIVCWEDEYGKHCPLIPLPKGHGAIKDVSQIEIPMCENRTYEKWVQVAINSAPTIIEADTGGTE